LPPDPRRGPVPGPPPQTAARLTYHLLRDVLWIPIQWGAASGGYSTGQVADAILALVFDGIFLPVAVESRALCSTT
jgi:hypothetical protein